SRHKRVYARLRRAMRGNERSLLQDEAAPGLEPSRVGEDLARAAGGINVNPLAHAPEENPWISELPPARRLSVPRAGGLAAPAPARSPRRAARWSSPGATANRSRARPPSCGRRPARR